MRIVAGWPQPVCPSSLVFHVPIILSIIYGSVRQFLLISNILLLYLDLNKFRSFSCFIYHLFNRGALKSVLSNSGLGDKSQEVSI